MKALKPLLISGREVLPLVEGGKGISVSNGESSGAWAAAGGIGTFSGVNADSFDDDGNFVDQVYRGKTRRERHEELVGYSIAGGITRNDAAAMDVVLSIKIASEMAGAQRLAALARCAQERLKQVGAADLASMLGVIAVCGQETMPCLLASLD